MTQGTGMDRHVERTGLLCQVEMRDICEMGGPAGFVILLAGSAKDQKEEEDTCASH